MQRRFFFTFVLLVATLLTAGCRESAQPTQPASNDASAQINVEFSQQPPQVGDDVLFVRVTGADGALLPLAELAVRGDMNHAGMQPVITSYESPEADENGSYVVPFTWTMGGDWILTVEARLQDGNTLSEQIDIAVES